MSGKDIKYTISLINGYILILDDIGRAVDQVFLFEILGSLTISKNIVPKPFHSPTFTNCGCVLSNTISLTRTAVIRLPKEVAVSTA